MKYELAKQLKDAGFLVPEYRDERRHSWVDPDNFYSDWCTDEDDIYVPTLSELIEALPARLMTREGNWIQEPKDPIEWQKFADNGWETAWFGMSVVSVSGNVDGWQVRYSDDDDGIEVLCIEGETPLEAVAKLWLELNKKTMKTTTKLLIIAKDGYPFVTVKGRWCSNFIRKFLWASHQECHKCYEDRAGIKVK